MSRASRRVYSTDSGRLCPQCERATAECSCRQDQQQARAAAASKTDGVLHIRREVKGRRGKPVTIVEGLPPEPLLLATLATALKQHCGSGGTVDGGFILIQGDHRPKVQSYLSDRGYQTRLSGG